MTKFLDFILVHAEVVCDLVQEPHPVSELLGRDSPLDIASVNDYNFRSYPLSQYPSFSI